MSIHGIPGKLEVSWRGDVKAIVDTWTDYSVTLEEFKEAVLVKGLNYARANGGVAYIVDSSKAKGCFSQDIQNFIGTDIFPAFVRGGIKYFITINSQVSALTQATVRNYQTKTASCGLKLIEVNSVQDAVMWLINSSKNAA
ncbi:MAG: hypothetical protein HY779_05250 [Rubrobacteridae bacterium]|nr:hypothetical protein [Rubrobacteridae bacterium]